MAQSGKAVNGIQNHIVLSEWVIEFSREFDDAFIKNAPENVIGFFAEDLSFPDEYGYRYHEVEAFNLYGEKIIKTEGAKAHQTYYWKDFIRNMAAYSIVTKWRYTELIGSAITCLNNREYVAAAVLARSGLELSAAFVDNSRYLGHNLKTVIEEKLANSDAVVLSVDLEEFSLRAMWGTRLGTPPKELIQKNVLGIIQRLSKNSVACDLISTYEFLCEAAHPNVIGNICYFDNKNELNIDGSRSKLLNRFAFAAGSKELVEKTLWAISWGCMATENSYRGVSDDLQRLLDCLGANISSNHRNQK